MPDDIRPNIIDECPECGALGWHACYFAHPEPGLGSQSGEEVAVPQASVVAILAEEEAIFQASQSHHYWLSIGRNVGLRPLPGDDWTEFRMDLRRLAQTWGGIVTDVSGDSQWQEGPEESYLLLVTVPPVDVSDLRYSLSRLASRWQQEAIGMVGGPGETLVYAQRGENSP